ncbi:type VI secretion system membrane subunit TssM [Motilimonas sp. KMU-193]|uniref:type VI secretion system membrane subunit TssM n=1 Tax=Motilimonas sp. KMU-193 TaxID=3388668 RepID=UPI00396B2478
MWNSFFSIIGRFKSLFRASVPGLLMAIFALLQIAIWWLGPRLEIDGEYPLSGTVARVIASAMLALIALSCWGIFQWRKYQKLQRQQQHESLLEQNPIQRFVERQERELNGVLQRLKHSLNSRNYLYSLPWYLVLGLENAGKTSLINRSGQRFVLSSVMRASGEQSENPYSFDWWIGDKAVLIDPDGELLTQQSTQAGDSDGLERNLWLHFIHWLEQKRSRRPLNGVVIALDIAHLASSDVAERKAYAYLIRARLRELMETLSTRLPVYITLTKLDLLHGFEPFFREYSKEQRDEVLGFTFSLDSVAQFDSWLQEFDHEYEQFLRRFAAMIPNALMQSRNSDEKAAIYSLHRQMAGLKRVLLQFFHDALSSDQFSTSALVRGVYFSSVFQQGVPVNAFVDAAAARYGMNESINRAQNAKNSTTYFTPNLFSKIIYPEAGLAGDNFRVAKQKRRLIGLSFVACSLASFLLVPAWYNYYQKNSQSADAVLQKVAKFNQLRADYTVDPTGKNLLEPLNLIRSATLEYGFFRDKPKYISDMGLYQGHLIGPEVEETYLKLLSYHYLPSLMTGVAKQLAQAPQGSDEKLAELRILRMLTDNSGRQDELIQAYFAAYWQQAFTGNRDMQEQLMGHLNYALEHTDLQLARSEGIADAETVLAPYDQLIANAQKELLQLPIEQRIFRGLQKQAEVELGGPLALRAVIGPVYDLVFDNQQQQVEIARLLTKQGFERFFVPNTTEISELALIDTWVLGLRDNINFSDEDKKVLQAKVHDLYQQAYIASWDEALAGVRIKNFKDINDAVMILSELTSSAKPLNRVLATLSDNTQLFPAMPDDEVAKQALKRSAQYKVASDIAGDFIALNEMLEAKGDKPAYLDEVNQSIAALHEYLKEIQLSPDQGRAALAATQKRIGLTDADPIYALQRVAEGLPAPLNQTVRQLAHDSWRVMMVAAIKHLEVMWYQDVYLEFEDKLAGRYPFDPSAKKDAELDDFVTFFAPDGTLEQFYQGQLKIFLEDSQGVEPGWTGTQALIRPDILARVNMAKQIQQAYFNQKGALDVEFTVEPLELSADKRRSIMNVDGQYVEYSHGPRRQTGLVWPNTLRAGAQTKVTLVPGAADRSPRSMTTQGPWALFRMLDKGKVTGTTAAYVDYEFAIDQGHMRYRVQADKKVNPFTSGLLESFELPQTLY